MPHVLRVFARGVRYTLGIIFVVVAVPLCAWLVAFTVAAWQYVLAS